MELLSLQNILLSYQPKGQSTLLGPLNLSIQKGEIVGLLGDSGSGKSSIGKVILGQLPIALQVASGLLHWHGNTPFSMEIGLGKHLPKGVAGKQIAAIFQNPEAALNPVLRIGTQWMETALLASNGDVVAAKKSSTYWQKAVQLDNIEDLFSRYPHQLSGGQQQRVVIALSMMQEPQLIIADEPTTALDSETEANIVALLKTLQAQTGISILWISHDPVLLSSVANSAFQLVEGQLVPYSFHDNTMKKASLAASKSRQIIMEASNIEHHYPKATSPTFTSISLNIQSGEMIGICGPSGSGKTTLGKILAGLELPSKGVLKLHLPRSTDVQMIFQNPKTALNPVLSIGQVLFEVLTIHYPTLKRSGIWEKLYGLLEQVGLSADLANRLPNELSGGQQQRISIARALACRPKLLICDEMTASLDASLKEEMLELLHQLCASTGCAVVLISHEKDLIQPWVERLLNFPQDFVE